MIAVIDYGVGNLFSVEKAVAALGAEVKVTSDKEAIESADKVILPGVVALAAAEGEQKASQCLLLALHKRYELFSRHTLFLLLVHVPLLCQHLLREHTATYEVAYEEGDADGYQCCAYDNDEIFALYAEEEIEQITD